MATLSERSPSARGDRSRAEIGVQHNAGSVVHDIDGFRPYAGTTPDRHSATATSNLRALGSSSLRSQRSGESLESPPSLASDVDTDDDSDVTDDDPLVEHAYNPPVEMGLNTPPASRSLSSSSSSGDDEELEANLPVGDAVEDVADAIERMNIRDDLALPDATDVAAEMGSWIDPKSLTAARPTTLDL